MRTSAVRPLGLEVWRCAKCGTQFTEQVEPDTLRRSGRTHLILNVDDHPASLYVRNRILRASGFLVEDATTGTAAWTAALRLRPHALLLDVHLPDTDGRQLCRRIRSDETLSRIPVVLISATLVSSQLPDCAEWGAAAFLHEPVTADVLAATIRNALTA
jgi:CheY-like chemotaxis protein